MAFVRLNALFLLQLSVLLFVLHVHAYPMPPAAAPKPAIKPIVKKIVVVQGVVYCKTVCKYIGVNTLLGASPLQGAFVKLVCHNNTKNSLVEQATTDKNGYFFFMSPKLSTAGARGCTVFLVKSPNPKCSSPTNMNRGSTGAVLNPVPDKKKQQAFSIHNVGPLAYEPAKKYPCH